MTTPRRFEQDLPALLADLYLAGTPDYRDDIVRRTARMRQRPAWTFPERWLPMDVVTRSVPTRSLPWRQLGVLALIGLLIAAALVAFVGSQQRELPAPFGLAANGDIAYEAGGDLYVADSATGSARPVTTGPETDLDPVWSLDGTRIVFERKVGGDSGPGWLIVSDADGRGLVRVTPEPLPGLATWSFSPDGRSIVAFADREHGPAIMVAASDGSAQPMFFDVGATSDDGAPQYRPDGSEIMFLGRQPGAAFRDLYALDPESGDVRTIIAGSVKADIHAAAWSPDGTRIAYSEFDQQATQRSSRTHVVATDGSGDIAVDTHPDAIADGGAIWSNDGTRLIINRFYPGGVDDMARSAIVPIDRSSVGVEMDCPPDATPEDCTAEWIWSPDDSVLLGAREGAGDVPLPQFLGDPLTGEIRPAPWTATGAPAWQRVAP
jgi:dipeptidyl aminopeptidase/acylaminoacyl peptidase